MKNTGSRMAGSLRKNDLMKKLCLYAVPAILLCCACLIIGLYSKASYADFNEESNPMERFTVGLLTEEMCERQIDLMRSTLDDSKYIVAARIADDFRFLPSCTTQSIEIVKVFKGDSLSVGETIDIVFSQEIFWNEESATADTAYINMGFANKLAVGETYLLFLDSEIETFNGSRMFIKLDKYLLMPVFSYDHEKIGWAQSENEDPEVYECRYMAVSELDYFLSSEKSADELKALRKEIIEKYQL